MVVVAVVVTTLAVTVVVEDCAHVLLPDRYL